MIRLGKITIDAVRLKLNFLVRFAEELREMAQHANVPETWNHIKKKSIYFFLLNRRILGVEAATELIGVTSGHHLLSNKTGAILSRRFCTGNIDRIVSLF